MRRLSETHSISNDEWLAGFFALSHDLHKLVTALDCALSFNERGQRHLDFGPINKDLKKLVKAVDDRLLKLRELKLMEMQGEDNESKN